MTDQLIGQTLADKYHIDSMIRDGDSNRVYRATHLLMDKPVTVKVLAPSLARDANEIALFSAEAKRVSHLAHPNILNAIDFGTDKNGTAFIVFDGADGETLSETLKRVGKLPVERAVLIAGQIAAALSAAHASGIVHGRLNSENVLLIKDPNGTESVKLLDFGAGANDAGAISLKNLQYYSPEQNSLGAHPDARSDIYALGVLFYEMLANEVPFVAGTRDELLIKQSGNPPAPLSAYRRDIIPDIEPIVLKALAKNPEMRYQSAREFVDDLNRATNTTTNAEPVVLPPLAADAPGTPNNNLWKTAFVVLAGISLLAVGLIYLTSTKQTAPTTMLQSDVNGQPVQPLNPATGMNEQGTAGLIPYQPGQMLTTGNSNMMTMPNGMPPAMPNGDGFGDGKNYWGGNGPPPGAPVYVPPGGQMIDPNNPNSIFMQDGTVLVPVPVNGNVSANAKPSPSPGGKTPPANVNANVAQPNPTPAANPSPNPAKTPVVPAVKPTVKPTAPPTAAPKPPAATQKNTAQSGKEQDS